MKKNLWHCDCNAVNEELAHQVLSQMPEEDFFERLSAFYKILGDPTRCKIIYALQQSELCVCDLAKILSMTKSSVSHQLGKMRQHGVVKCRRSGKEVYYTLDDAHVVSILCVSSDHIRHKHKEVTH